jgi:hypothetical protein
MGPDGYTDGYTLAAGGCNQTQHDVVAKLRTKPFTESDAVIRNVTQRRRGDRMSDDAKFILGFG